MQNAHFYLLSFNFKNKYLKLFYINIIFYMKEQKILYIENMVLLYTKYPKIYFDIQTLDPATAFADGCPNSNELTQIKDDRYKNKNIFFLQLRTLIENKILLNME